MENTDRLLQTLATAKTHKSVHFAPGVKEAPQKIYTPLERNRREPNYARMRKSLLDLLAKQRYEEAASYLHSYTQNEVKEFCKQFAKGIFNLILIYSKDVKELYFLLSNISQEQIVETLVGDNILSKFIQTESRLEQEKGLAPEQIKLFSEKIKVLKEYGNPQINNTITEIASHHNIGSNVKSVVEGALVESTNKMEK